VGQAHALVVELELAEQQHVDVDRPGTVADAVLDAPELSLQALQGVEQLQCPQVGPHAQAGVEERRLVGHLPDGVGVVGGRGGEHLHAGAGEGEHGGLQLGAAIAEVAAEAEQPDALRAHPSASRQTSTDTSSTLSAIGGSGLAALTHTPSSS